jgi:hypothetical protein
VEIVDGCPESCATLLAEHLGQPVGELGRTRPADAVDRHDRAPDAIVVRDLVAQIAQKDNPRSVRQHHVFSLLRTPDGRPGLDRRVL